MLGCLCTYTHTQTRRGRTNNFRDFSRLGVNATRERLAGLVGVQRNVDEKNNNVSPNVSACTAVCLAFLFRRNV